MPRQSNASAYDWLTAEDVVRHALAAYYSASRNADAGAAAFPDEPSYTDPADASWANSCRVGLGEQIAQDLEVRLLAHAEKQGIEWGAQRVDKFSADTTIPRVFFRIQRVISESTSFPVEAVERRRPLQVSPLA